MSLTAPAPTTTPRLPALDRATAARLAATEYERFLSQQRDLPEDAWSRATDCTQWDVRDVAGHVLGMAEMAASLRETVRQQWRAARRGGDPLDALTSLQVEEHADLSREQVLDALAAAGPRAARGRARTPGLLRRRTLPGEQRVGDTTEPWTIGYLTDVILTRDTWMHRIDVARAGQRAPVLTADHDGVLVADVAAEWAGRHGQPCTLHLTGPAGGTWSWGSGGPDLQVDAVEFCRLLSGRGRGEGLLATQVPF